MAYNEHTNSRSRKMRTISTMRMGNKTRMLTNEESVFDGSIQACKSPTFNLSKCTLSWIIISMFGNVEIQRCMIVSVSGVRFIHSYTDTACVLCIGTKQWWTMERGGGGAEYNRDGLGFWYVSAPRDYSCIMSLFYTDKFEFKIYPKNA